MKQVKVALAQKAFGTAELIVGSKSMLINCPIFFKLINTKSEFTFTNALMIECTVSVKDKYCSLKIDDMEAEVDKVDFFRAIHGFCGELAEKGMAYIDVKPYVIQATKDVPESQVDKNENESVMIGGVILNYDY